ncbi:MAG: TRIC cation channel family protein [Epsilonproteobacteria bacterium]|nr:TRIC cation channel family protein [Campylobacterota bacterium]
MEKFLIVTDIIGIISFSISGFLIAIYYKFDLVGVFIASTLTALGGGIIRDGMIGQMPFAFTHNYPFYVIVGTVAIMSTFKIHRIKDIENHFIYVLSDSIGLVAFSIMGALIALREEVNLLGTIVITLLTAVGGGTIRDVLTNKIPFFMEKDFYAVIAICIGIFFYFINGYVEIDLITILVVFVVFLFIRLLAYYKKWSVPFLH